MYSVKWYKGGLEIFRFIPSNSPPIAVFVRYKGIKYIYIITLFTLYDDFTLNRPGVSIDTERSNATSLHLANLTVASTGRYR